MRLRCRPILLPALAAALFFLPAGLHAQAIPVAPDSSDRSKTALDSTSLQVLKTVGGETFIGRTTVRGKEELRFRTKYGTVTIPLADIESVEDIPIDALRKSGYWFPNPNRTRLFFAPKGRMLEKGRGYFQNIYVFFGGVEIGLTDNIMIGGGMSLFPGTDEQLYYVTPKVGANLSEKFSLAAGALVVNIPGEDEGSAGVYYGVATYGSVDRSVTFGMGYAFRDNDAEDDVMVMWGVDYRLSRRTALVSENWTFPGVKGPLISAGFRFFGERMAVDLAFATAPGESEGVLIPYVDFVLDF